MVHFDTTHPSGSTRSISSAQDVLGELDEAAGERWLFHGTSGKGVEGITNTDFRLDLAGTGAGLLYGRGIYLAESCMKADEYSVKVDTKLNIGKL